MKASVHRPDPDPEDHDIILIVFAVAMLITLCLTPEQAHGENFYINPYFQDQLRDYDSEADRRSDAIDQTQHYEQTVPLFSPEGFEGFATQNPDGSIYIDLDGNLDGGYYDY